MIVPVTIYLAIVAILSGISLWMMGIDKRRARLGQRRIPEKRFFLVALFGGWPGAFLGQYFFRHKTVKLRFRVGIGLVSLIHVVIVGFVFWYTTSRDLNV